MPNLVGDVSSAARILPDLNGEKLFIRKGKGACLEDADGRRYIDTALGFGAVLLGHANDRVNMAVSEALGDSAAPSWAHVREHGAATALASHTGELSKVIFTNSGSEAVHLACRAARAYTGRGKIAKMAGGFDGWFDDVSYGNVSSTEAGFEDGQRPSTERTTLLRYNDFADVERLFAEDPDIAAVVLEPMLANAGCIMALPGYLKHVQEIAHQHGALVICDEVLMGFRLGDLWTDLFRYSRGEKAGETGVSLKARLLFVSWVKVDGKLVYQAHPKAESDDAVAAQASDTSAIAQPV